MSERKNYEQWRHDEMGENETELNAIFEDIQETAAMLFGDRESLKNIQYEAPQDDARRSAVKALNEALMLVDDALAIMADELGAESE